MRGYHTCLVYKVEFGVTGMYGHDRDSECLEVEQPRIVVSREALESSAK